MNKASDFIRELSYDELNTSVVQKAKLCLLDGITSTLTGYNTKAAKISRSIAQDSVSSSENVSILSTSGSCILYEAVFANSMAASAWDIDDGNRAGGVHPGALIIPTALGCAEKAKASGKKLIVSMVKGYEIGLRAKEAMLRGMGGVIGKKRLYGTGRWASLGVAAVAASLFNLTKAQIRNALGLSATFTPVAPLLDDLRVEGTMPMSKESIGWATIVGLYSAVLASQGFTGLKNILDFSSSDFGSLGSNFAIKQIKFKPFPCCRWVQPAVEAVLEISNSVKLKAEEVKKIEVSTFRQGLDLGNPTPPNIESAQYSIPFCIAVAIINDDLTPDHIKGDNLNRQNVLDVASRVNLVHKSEFDDLFGEATPALVKIESKKEKTFSRTVKYPKGNIQNPMRKEDIIEKFKKLTSDKLSPANQNKILHTIEKLEEHTNPIPEIFRLIKE